MPRAQSRMLHCVAMSWLGLLYGCGGGEADPSTEQSSLVAVCAASAESLPDGSWQCGSPQRIECDSAVGSAGPPQIYVVRGTGCNGQPLLVNPGPFPLGEHEVIVSETVAGVDGMPATSREVCRSALSVVDTTPPRATPSLTELWPPNHELHSLTAEQCAGTVDACDVHPSVRFSSASSDEPVDTQGDGSTEPDIVFDGPERVSLRAERQGGSNGRLYTLGWSAVDASGNRTEGVCRVVVPHDSSGEPVVADAPAYSIMAPP